MTYLYGFQARVVDPFSCTIYQLGVGGFTYSRCEPYRGIEFGLQITAGNHSKCTLILYYINETESSEAMNATACWGSLAQCKETGGEPGLISALRYNLCALICNSITQADPSPVGGATVATVATVATGSQCSLAAFNYVNLLLCRNSQTRRQQPVQRQEIQTSIDIYTPLV